MEKYVVMPNNIHLMLRIEGTGRTLCAPTEEKILCRSPISQRSHVGNLRQTIQGKGVIHKRVETLVSTLLCPCRAGKISFASQALNHRLAETNKQY